MNKKAFLFDLNGTMIDDMEYHVVAWSDILNNDLKAGLSYEQVKKQMYGKNDEVLARIFGEGYFHPHEVRELSVEKERRYQRAYLPELRLIKGLHEFLEKARQEGILLAIGSAAIPFNIDFVLDNLKIREYFGTIVSADDVDISKPHPETYLKCAAQLGISPSECLVFEDAPKGVEAAMHAGMQTVVITTMHQKDEFALYNNVKCFIEDYTSLNPAQLI